MKRWSTADSKQAANRLNRPEHGLKRQSKEKDAVIIMCVWMPSLQFTFRALLVIRTFRLNKWHFHCLSLSKISISGYSLQNLYATLRATTLFKEKLHFAALNCKIKSALQTPYPSNKASIVSLPMNFILNRSKCSSLHNTKQHSSAPPNQFQFLKILQLNPW